MVSREDFSVSYKKSQKVVLFIYLFICIIIFKGEEKKKVFRTVII